MAGLTNDGPPPGLSDPGTILGEVDGTPVPAFSEEPYSFTEEAPLEQLAHAIEDQHPNGWAGWITVDGDEDPQRPLSKPPASEDPKAIREWFEERLAGLRKASPNHTLGISALEYRRSASGKGWHLRFKVKVSGKDPSVWHVYALRASVGDDEHRLGYDARRSHADPASIGGWLSDRSRVPIQDRGGLVEYIWKEAGPWIVALP